MLARASFAETSVVLQRVMRREAFAFGVDDVLAKRVNGRASPAVAKDLPSLLHEPPQDAFGQRVPLHLAPHLRFEALLH